MLRLSFKALVVSGAFVSAASDQDALARDRFLTLPYTASGIRISEGWLYNTPGPFICPIAEGGNRCHKGIDYSNSGMTFDVKAAAEGRAVASNDPNFGNFVYIAHDQYDDQGRRFYTLYAHLQNGSWSVPTITKNQLTNAISTQNFSSWMRVDRGKTLGRAGSEGTSDGIHLHFEVHRGGWSINKVDPYGINGTSAQYPGTCGSAQNVLWIECPPRIPSCTNLYTAAAPVPSGYGAAYNLFASPPPPSLGQRELVVEAASCAGTKAVLAIGTGRPSGQYTQYIYRYAKQWRNNQWEQIPLIGGGPLESSGNYYIGDATLVLSRTTMELSQNNFLAVYICTLVGTQWKCGCRDSACAQSLWQVQGFRSGLGTR